MGILTRWCPPLIKTRLNEKIVGMGTSYDRSYTCVEFELRAYDCIHAYGIIRGWSMCRDYMKDMNECGAKTKQMLRFEILQTNYKKKVEQGKAEWKEIIHPDSC